jgi:Zn-dependent protease
MNLILALLAVVANALVARFAPQLAMKPLFDLMILINVALMVFNLLPVPPLDGSKFLMYWFGMSETTYIQFSRFGWLILMVFINLPQTRGLLSLLIYWGLQPFNTLASLLA